MLNAAKAKQGTSRSNVLDVGGSTSNRDSVVGANIAVIEDEGVCLKMTRQTLIDSVCDNSEAVGDPDPNLPFSIDEPDSSGDEHETEENAS